MCGESLWIVIPYPERDKLYQLVQEMATAHASWSARQGKKKSSSKAQTRADSLPAPAPTAAADVATLSRILLFSKNLFPPLSLLAKHGIKYYRIPLKAGQVLIAHGGFSHCGFSTAKGETHSIASNMVTERWLTTGGPEFLIHFFEWVQRLSQMDKASAGMGKGRSKLRAQLDELGISIDQLSTALNVCPPAYACGLLRGMKADLLRYARAFSQRATASAPDVVGLYTLTAEETGAAIVKLDRAMELLHAVRSFLQQYYVDPCSDFHRVCDCGRSEDADAMLALFADKEAPEEASEAGESEDDVVEAEQPSRNVSRAAALDSSATGCILEPSSAALERKSEEEERRDEDTEVLGHAEPEQPGATNASLQDADADADAVVPTAAALNPPPPWIGSPYQRRLDKRLLDLNKLLKANSNEAVASVQYTAISPHGCRCWYASVSQALRQDSVWSIQASIKDAVHAVTDAATAVDLGFPGAHASCSRSQLAAMKEAYTTSENFQSATWGGDMEMHLLSYAYRGALSFLVYRDELPAPTAYRYSGPHAIPARVEIALHWCCLRPRRGGCPDHYNLLSYCDSTGRTQPFWWVASEEEAHQQARRERLRRAVLDNTAAHQQYSAAHLR